MTKHKIVIECNPEAKDELIPLLQELEHMGHAGNSRSIKIEDWDGNNNFGFDGDGPSQILNITVDGQKLSGTKKEAKMSNLKEQLIRLGNTNKGLRHHIREILPHLNSFSRKASGVPPKIQKDLDRAIKDFKDRARKAPEYPIHQEVLDALESLQESFDRGIYHAPHLSFDTIVREEIPFDVWEFLQEERAKH